MTSFKGPCCHAIPQVPTSKCGHIASLCMKGKSYFNPPHTWKWQWMSAFTVEQRGRQFAGCHADRWMLSYSQLPPSNFYCGHYMKEHQTQGDKTSPVNRSLICGNYFTFVGVSSWDSPFSFALNTCRGLNFLLGGRILVLLEQDCLFSVWNWVLMFQPKTPVFPLPHGKPILISQGCSLDHCGCTLPSGTPSWTVSAP